MFQKIIGHSANGEQPIKDSGWRDHLRLYEFHADGWFTGVPMYPDIRSALAALPGVTILDSPFAHQPVKAAHLKALSKHGVTDKDTTWTAAEKLYAAVGMTLMDPHV